MSKIVFFNLLIWTIVCLFPLGLVFAEIKTKKDFFKKFVILSSAIILAMQSVGIATASSKADFARYDNSYYFSVDKQLELSRPNPPGGGG